MEAQNSLFDMGSNVLLNIAACCDLATVADELAKCKFSSQQMKAMNYLSYISSAVSYTLGNSSQIINSRREGKTSLWTEKFMWQSPLWLSLLIKMEKNPHCVVSVILQDLGASCLLRIVIQTVYKQHIQSSQRCICFLLDLEADRKSCGGGRVWTSYSYAAKILNILSGPNSI